MITSIADLENHRIYQVVDDAFQITSYRVVRRFLLKGLVKVNTGYRLQFKSYRWFTTEREAVLYVKLKREGKI